VVSQMESQHADANEELLLELKSKNTTRSIKDFSPEGIRLESNLEGEAKGVYDATFYATITMLVKPDRTIDYEVRQIHTTSDGDTEAYAKVSLKKYKPMAARNEDRNVSSGLL